MDLKIDDLLEKQKENDKNAVLDLEYVQLNVPKVLALFNKVSKVFSSVVRSSLTWLAVLKATIVRYANQRCSLSTKPSRVPCKLVSFLGSMDYKLLDPTYDFNHT